MQHTFPKQGNLERPHIGHGRARSKRKKPDPINQAINRPSGLSQENPGRTKLKTRKSNSMHTTSNAVNNNPFIPDDVPSHLDLLLRLKQPTKQNITHKQNPQNEQNINPNINFDFKKSPFQEGIMSETFQRLENHSFKTSKS